MHFDTYTPLVSAIVPTYNSQNTIINCIDSILNQTYTNIEIIIVDDGSTDNTVKLINEFSIGKEKTHIIEQSNRGPSSARNTGINYAHGEYIAFLDSDDEWYPNKIEKQIQLYKKNKDAVLISCSYSIGEQFTQKRQSNCIRKISFNNLLLKNSFITSTVICPRKIFKDFHFNEKQKYSEDYRLWLQIAATKRSCLLSNEILTKMNNKPLFGSKGLSSKLWLMEKGELSNFKFIYKQAHISFPHFLLITLISILKFLKRLLLTKIQ